MIRLGVAGLGLRATGLARVLREVEPELRVTAVADPKGDALRERLPEDDRADAAFHPDLRAMLAAGKVDALLVGTRCDLHTDLAVEALASGLPLFLEKPVAVTMEQALRLEDAWRRAPDRTVVSFPLRVSPLCRRAQKLVAGGATGTPLHVLAHNYVSYGCVYFEVGYRQYDVTRGLFLQKATHDFDYLMALLGQSIRRVAASRIRGRVFGGDKPADLVCSACGERRTCPESPESRIANAMGGVHTDHLCVFSSACGSPETGMNEDASQALLEFDGGAIGAYAQVFFCRRHGRRGATVSGYDGTLAFDWSDETIRVTEHLRQVEQTLHVGSGAGHSGGDHELARDFVALIREGKKPRAGLAEGLQSVYACLAAEESIARDGFVDVRQVGQA